MKRIILILILALLYATFALSQPFKNLIVGSPIEQMAYSPDSSLLAVASREGLYLCDIERDELRLLIKGYIVSVAFSPDGKMLAAGADWQNGLPDDWQNDQHWRDDWQETIYIWDLQNEKQTELKRHAGSVQSVSSICFSSDSKTLISGDLDGVWFWSIDREQIIGQLALDNVYSFAYRHDGNMLAVGTYNTIFLVDPIGRKIHSVFSHRDEFIPELWILCIGFNPDWTILASGSGDNVVNLWDVSNLKRIEQLQHNGNVHFLSFTPDGRQIVYAGWGRIIRIYDMISKETISWEGSYTISSGALSPDGRTLATAGAEGIISFWEMPKPATGIRSLNKKFGLWGSLKSGR